MKRLSANPRRTAGQRELYRHANGTFKLPFLKVEAAAVHRKYAQHGGEPTGNATESQSLEKRATGKVELNSFDQGIEYSGLISVGTPPQLINVVFDTASADLWLPVFDTHMGFLHTDVDKTYKNTGAPFSSTFAGGNVSGSIATDTVAVAGIAVAKQSFGAVTSASASLIGNPYGIAGVLGLAFSSIAKTRQPTFIENLISARKLTSNLFAFYLLRENTKWSELSIGALNNARYTGNITYTPVISKTYWEVQATAPLVAGKAVAVAGFPAAIDTGTILIYLPKSVASAIYSAIPNSSKDSIHSTSTVTSYTFPCSKTPSVALTFAGSTRSYPINKADFNLGSSDGVNCVGAIVGADNHDKNGNLFAIVGDSFLKSYYSVFNYEAPGTKAPAVGFATLR